ncbi:MAG: aerobic carbon-monoxide dehydrogenase medium subunit [Chloroflexota bacterium]|jgi:carbon-monoxide dehydrogenase medium subunit|nr:aerobic carbon-monoxide dehydrogenase medium subunit [Chloroflexota bacterium]
MILDNFDYVAPGSLAEAVAALATGPTTRPLAGGRGLLTELKRGERRVERLVDLRGIAALRGVDQLPDGRVRVGALTTLAELLVDPSVRAAHVPGALGDAVPEIEDPQARNRSTVGGTLAGGDPGSDLAAVMLAVGASVNCVGPDGERVIAIDQLFGPDRPTCLAPDELITSVDLDLAEPGGAYERFADRARLDAICGVAVTVALGADGRLARCRIAVAGVTAWPRRLDAVEHALSGAGIPVTMPPVFEVDGVVDDHAASARYRIHLVRVLAERAFVRAVERARAGSSRS